MPRPAFCLALALVFALLVPTSAQAPSSVGGTPSVAAETSPNMLGTIQGNVLDSAGAPLADMRVRLRDARLGHIVGTTVTDAAGLFAFQGVEPGTYVAELMDEETRVLATSQLLNVEAGWIVSSVIQLPLRTEPFGGLLGHTLPAALAVASAAATAGLLATTVSGDPDSP